jgi:hypothetical protein
LGFSITRRELDLLDYTNNRSNETLAAVPSKYTRLQLLLNERDVNGLAYSNRLATSGHVLDAVSDLA